MSKKKSKFDFVVEEISKLNRDDTGAVKSTAFSAQNLSKLGDALVNDPDYQVENVSLKDGKPTVTISEPVKDFRNGLKKLVKDEFGIDAAEADKLDNCTMPKTVGSAVAEMSGVLVSEYMKTGKSFRLPMTSEDEARMQISLREVAEKVEATKKPVEVAPGRFEMQPTGKTIKTKKHMELKVSNKVPDWLKSEI